MKSLNDKLQGCESGHLLRNPADGWHYQQRRYRDGRQAAIAGKTCGATAGDPNTALQYRPILLKELMLRKQLLYCSKVWEYALHRQDSRSVSLICASG